MILTEVRDYIKRHRQIALRDMALQFGMEQDALRPIIEQWVTKGKVVKLPEGTTCGSSCSNCAPDTIEIYQWVD